MRLPTKSALQVTADARWDVRRLFMFGVDTTRPYAGAAPMAARVRAAEDEASGFAAELPQLLFQLADAGFGLDAGGPLVFQGGKGPAGGGVVPP